MKAGRSRIRGFVGVVEGSNCWALNSAVFPAVLGRSVKGCGSASLADVTFPTHAQLSACQVASQHRGLYVKARFVDVDLSIPLSLRNRTGCRASAR